MTQTAQPLPCLLDILQAAALESDWFEDEKSSASDSGIWCITWCGRTLRIDYLMWKIWGPDMGSRMDMLYWLAIKVDCMPVLAITACSVDARSLYLQVQET